jgi:hypothetical protein
LPEFVGRSLTKDRDKCFPPAGHGLLLLGVGPPRAPVQWYLARHQREPDLGTQAVDSHGDEPGQAALSLVSRVKNESHAHPRCTLTSTSTISTHYMSVTLHSLHKLRTRVWDAGRESAPLFTEPIRKQEHQSKRGITHTSSSHRDREREKKSPPTLPSRSHLLTPPIRDCHSLLYHTTMLHTA